MKEIPGVTSAALSASTPFQGGLPINAFTLETDTRGHHCVHASKDSPPNPGAAGVREKPFENIVRLLQQFGRLSAPATGQLHIGELREQPREEQPFAHAARRSDALSQRRLRL